MADAAHYILTSKASEFTGRFLMDDEILISKGAFELSSYACVPGTRDDELLPDYFC